MTIDICYFFTEMENSNANTRQLKWAKAVKSHKDTERTKLQKIITNFNMYPKQYTYVKRNGQLQLEIRLLKCNRNVWEFCETLLKSKTEKEKISD